MFAKRLRDQSKVLMSVSVGFTSVTRSFRSRRRQRRVKSGLVCKIAFRGTTGDGRLGGHHPLLLVRDFNQRLYDFRCHELLKSFGTEKSSARLSLMAFFNQDCAHGPYQRLFIGEYADHAGAALSFPVEPLNMIGCSAEPPESRRQSHHSHGTLKSFIQAEHG